MATPNDDPALQHFLATQAKPAATTDDLAKLGRHTRSNPLKKRGPDRAIIYIVAISMFVRFVAREMRTSREQPFYSKPFRVELTQEQAREVLEKLEAAKSTPAEVLGEVPQPESP